ncbi:MAG: GNAT family N-acetyltransferase [Candidatus Dormibacteria bacterium]
MSRSAGAPSGTGLDDAARAEVTVRALADADAGDFIAAVRASRSLHHPWIDLPDTAERFASYLNHVARDDQAAYLVRHSLCRGLVGYVSVGNIVRGAFQSAYLGYAAFAGHSGRGLMTAGLRSVLGVAFGELGLHRIEANIQPANVPSIALVRRLGFEREGYSPRYLMVDGDWRDHERWALRAEDFTA